MPNRPSKRTLVRWNDDHDKELFLWTVYCCGEQGIKIPWGRIAQCMGPSFTEGACVQHLAKLRNRVEAAGLHAPPPQKRGTVTKSGSSIYPQVLKHIDAPPPRTRPAGQPGSQADAYVDDEDTEDEHDDDSQTVQYRPESEDTVSSNTRSTLHLSITGGLRRKSSAMTAADDDEEDEDYEPETPSKGRSKKARTARGSKKPKVSPKKNAVAYKQEADTQDDDRTIMPPPSLSNINDSSTLGWNSSFMYQPFGASSGQGINFSSTASYETPSIGAGYLANSTYTYPYPNFQANQSRNTSFASISTLDAQPALWTQGIWNPPIHRRSSDYVEDADDLFVGPTETTEDGTWADWINDDHLP